MKAVFINRIGDFGFFMAICLLFVDYGTLNIYELSYATSMVELYWVMLLPPYIFGGICVTNVEIICAFLFIAVMSKSAQFGLHN